jgi:hypothetical protein
MNKVIPLLIVIIACSACSPQKIRGRPPFIGISSLVLVENTLSADFDIRNPNDEEMTIDAIDISMTLQETQISRSRDDLRINISAQGIEEIHVESLPDEFARKLLSSLESGEVISLPYQLEGRVHTLENGYLSFDDKGHLYPVPGRPGQFRGAGAQGEVREPERWD